MKDVKSLTDMIMGLRYKNDGDPYEYSIINKKHYAAIQSACAEWYAESMTDQIQLQSEIGRLQAMVTAYEAILRNSNFAMAVIPKQENNEKIDRETLLSILSDYFDIGDSYTYELTRVKEAFAIGTMSLEDFQEWDDEKITDLCDYIIQHMGEVAT